MSFTCVIIGKSVTKFMAVQSCFHSTFLTPFRECSPGISDPRSRGTRRRHKLLDGPQQAAPGSTAHCGPLRAKESA